MESIINVKSNRSFTPTLEKVIDLIRSKGFSVFARIDHSTAAHHQNMELRPTELIIFGNPEVGTLLMQDQQTCGIDLPAKILVWEDSTDVVWITFSDMNRLAGVHHLNQESIKVLTHISETVESVCYVAAQSGRSGSRQ